jgi:hypothetical protein
VAVNRHDGVVHVEQHRPVDTGSQRSGRSQSEQEPGCDRVELTDLAKAELARNEPSVEGA